MGATTTHLTLSLLNKVRQDFPAISFKEDTLFAWSPDTHTVHYAPLEPNGNELLLHELSHGIIGHSDYKKDVTLLAMETAAWDHAASLASTYGIAPFHAVAEANLDTYRDWLHARSTCPDCTATGYQVDAATYSCPACGSQWHVNEARACALRRHRIVG